MVGRYSEMIQKNFQTALKKGEIGEDIVREYLESKGWIVYSPITKDKAHYFDQLATKDKKKVIAIDVKTKARLNKWAAQGINIKHYQEYMRFVNDTNIPFYLVFVDDKNGDVHCQELKKLSNPISVNNKIIAWYLSEMIFLFNIGEEKINKLSEYDQRNYNYLPK